MGNAMITGATSGLGEEFARQLARCGHDLVLVARRREVLVALADELHAEHGVTVEVITADLTRREDLDLVATRLDVGGPQDDPRRRRTRPVGLLVNNAGAGLGVSFAEDSLEREEAALDLNVRAVMVLSHHALGQMIHRGRGAILNVSSLASETGAGTYSAHKAWVRAFTEGLAIECAGTGVSATCVMPGPTRTAFFEHAGAAVHALPDWMWASPQEVVRCALRALRRRQVLVTPHPVHKIAMAAMRLAPRRLTRAVVRKTPHM